MYNKYINKTKKYAASFFIPFMAAIPLYPAVAIIEKYLFSDWEFLKYLIVFMTIDTLTSWWYHIREKSFSSKGFARLFTKIIIYSILLIIAHGFAAHTVSGEIIEPLKWFRTFICTALMVREGLSIIENLNKIMPGIIPPAITKYLNDFDENGKFKKNN